MSLSRLLLSSLLSAICISVVKPFNVAAFISSPPKIFVRPLERNRSPKNTKHFTKSLCTHEDDNLTDLYVDPREEDNIEIDNKDVLQCYGDTVKDGTVRELYLHLVVVLAMELQLMMCGALRKKLLTPWRSWDCTR